MAVLNSPLTALGALPTATKAMLLILTTCSLTLAVLHGFMTPNDLKQVLRGSQDSLLAFPWIVAVPGSIVYTPWTLLTAGFVEGNIVELAVSGTSIFFAGRYLERIYGQSGFLQFCAVVIIASNIGSVAVSALQWFVLGDAPFYLHGQAYHGMMGLQTGFLVALTQLIPEHQVQIFGGIAKLRVKQLPMIYVTISNIMVIIGFQSPFILIQFGWLAAWAWLRFFKYNEGSDFRGDRSETFAFAIWFPPFLQPYVVKLSNLVFPIFVRLHILQPWGTDLESGYTVAGGTRAEAERRRAMALKALDNRLARQPSPAPEATTSAASPAKAAVAVPTAAQAEKSDVVFDAAAEQ